MTLLLDCDSYSPALLDLLISSDISISSTMAFLLLGNSDHVVVSISRLSVKCKRGCCILGPTPFLLYINELPDDVICIAIHAGDTTLFF